jgi:glycosyltransferase involved in cell wall biosynthesis
MNPPLVSILIPAHNAAPWLAATLDSALAQTWPAREVIVVENGSTDRTLAIAQTYADRGVRVLALPAMTAAAARNRAFAECHGDFIQYLDADDLLSPDKLAAQVGALAGLPTTVAVCARGDFADGESIESARLLRDWPVVSSDAPCAWLSDLLGAHGRAEFVALHQWLTPRGLIERVGNWDESLTVNDDGEFFARVVLGSTRIVATPAPVAYYRRQRPGQSLSSRFRRRAEDTRSMLRSIDLITAHLEAAGAEPAVRSALSRHYYECAVLAYPLNPEVSRLAEQRALALRPSAQPPPPTSRLAACLRRVAGWRAERRVADLARRWLPRS